MPELLKKIVTRDELDNGIVLNNTVLCVAFYTSEGARTKAGIVYGFNTDLTYNAGDDPNDKTSWVADLAETCMRVYKVPQKLYFNPEDGKSMDWETEMELQEGDLVWSNPIEALNAITLVCEGKLYKLIPYQDCYVCKRKKTTHRQTRLREDGYPGNEIRIVKTEEWVPFCLNGFVLCKEVHKESLSYLDVTTEDKIDMTKGIVAYYGSCNARYRFPEHSDFQDLQKDDLILYDKKASPFLLERTSYANKFSDNGELYYVVQRRYISAVLKRNG